MSDRLSELLLWLPTGFGFKHGLTSTFNGLDNVSREFIRSCTPYSVGIPSE